MADVLHALSAHHQCGDCRMSGGGACCCGGYVEENRARPCLLGRDIVGVDAVTSVVLESSVEVEGRRCYGDATSRPTWLWQNMRWG